MKYKIFVFFFLISGLFALVSCYDDKGSNDFDTVLPDVEIVIPQSAYSATLGGTISIQPIVKTDIDASDLEYHWEVNGNVKNSQNRDTFSPLVEGNLQSETLNYVCKLDDNITALNKSYECRLRVHQKSTGRDFYSSDTFTITIEGLSGLMVLYDDANSCDVGMLCADEFMPSSSSIPETPTATMSVFSSANNGAKLAGKGREVYQGIASGLEWSGDDSKDRMRIFVRTDQATYWLNRNDLSILGDWNHVFYLQGDRKQNEGNPKGFVLDGTWGAAFDGDDVFMMQTAYQDKYLFPTMTAKTDFNGRNMTFSPVLMSVESTGSIQRLMYANSVNGNEERKGFVAITNGAIDNINMYTKLLDTSSDQVAFNPGDMKADLVAMANDSRAHVVAVMKGLPSHPLYANRYFFVDLDTGAPVAGESSYAGIPNCCCSMENLTDVDRAINFCFGSSINMYYYATPNGVYRYGLDGTNLIASQPLCMTDGTAVSFDGEITMMKRLCQDNVTRHDNDEIILVATYQNGKSALYALHLDTMTGNVVKSAKYSSDNVDGWNFGKIYDVNIKSL